MAALQPKVFDLLAYLARERHRVVSKDELLEAIWPGVVVTDGSLQRAVSLARAALGELGVGDAIRTHSRQGYRFCEAPGAGADGSNGRGGDSALDRARAAYRRGAWSEAIAALRAVDDLEGLSGADLQRWAHAAQCMGHPDEALPVLERAVAAHAARGEPLRAAWAAILSAHLHLEWSEAALANGWLHRAARLLEGQPAGREQGYIDLMRARMALLGNRLDEVLAHGESARKAGRACGDADLESIALVHVGEANLYLGRVAAGLDALDEAGASVVASGLSPWAGGLVYCGVIYSYLTRADWQRAGQWTEQFTRWCERNGPGAYPGLCRMHRAEVLTVQGALVEAEKEIDATIGMLARHSPWACGDAWRARGDILLARGAYPEARAAYLHASERGWDAAFGLALVRYHEGDAAGALRELRRGLDDLGYSFRSKRGLSLLHTAIVAIAAGELALARAVLAELEAAPELHATPALEALRMQARGELLAAEGDVEGSIRMLRAALRAWHALHAPLAGAEVRRSLARQLCADGDVTAAADELEAAIGIFRRAGAEQRAGQCEHLRSQLPGAA